MPEYPSLFVLHSLEEEFSERIERRLAVQAIINVLIVLIRFEPEFVGIRKKKQTEEQEDEDKSERGTSNQHSTPLIYYAKTLTFVVYYTADKQFAGRRAERKGGSGVQWLENSSQFERSANL